jgi:hypothetical protein
MPYGCGILFNPNGKAVVDPGVYGVRDPFTTEWQQFQLDVAKSKVFQRQRYTKTATARRRLRLVVSYICFHNKLAIIF